MYPRERRENEQIFFLGNTMRALYFRTYSRMHMIDHLIKKIQLKYWLRLYEYSLMLHRMGLAIMTVYGMCLESTECHSDVQMRFFTKQQNKYCIDSIGEECLPWIIEKRGDCNKAAHIKENWLVNLKYKHWKEKEIKVMW